MPSSPNSTSLGLQPLAGPIPLATPAPGESSTFQRPDGAYQAIPKPGAQRVLHLVERAAPWTLKPGLTVLANNYNGVVPGPVLVVESRRSRRHRLHERIGARPTRSICTAIHEIPVVDGRRRRHLATARAAAAGTTSTASPPTRPARSCITRTATKRSWIPDCTARSSCEPTHPRPEERDLAHDFVEMITGWQIQSARRKSLDDQRQRISGHASDGRRTRRALPHSLDQLCRRRHAHDAHARALPADHRARRATGRLRAT